MKTPMASGGSPGQEITPDDGEALFIAFLRERDRTARRVRPGKGEVVVGDGGVGGDGRRDGQVGLVDGLPAAGVRGVEDEIGGGENVVLQTG